MYAVRKSRWAGISARPSAAGFSLVELLVVLGIIAFLVALLMPVLHSSRQRAEQVKCAAQLRQIGYALTMYANANGGYLPSTSAMQTYPPKQPGDGEGPGWTEILAGHFVAPDSPIYHCPSFSEVDVVTNYFLAARWPRLRGRRTMKLSEVKTLSKYVLSGDTSNVDLYPTPYGPLPSDDCDKSDETVNCASFPTDYGGFAMHTGGNNILFDDMHVQAFKQFEPAEMTFSGVDMLRLEDVPSELPPKSKK